MTLRQTYQCVPIKTLGCRRRRTIVRMKAKTQRRKRAKMLWWKRSGKGSEPTLQVLTGGTLLKVRQGWAHVEIIVRASQCPMHKN